MRFINLYERKEKKEEEKLRTEGAHLMKGENASLLFHKFHWCGKKGKETFS